MRPRLLHAPSRCATFIAFAIVAALACPTARAGKTGAKSAARWYVDLLPTDAATGVPAAVLESARKLLHDDLAARPEWTLDPAGAPPPSDPKALGAYLAAHHLEGYSLHARILALTQSLLPPAPGKTSKILEVSVKVTLVGAHYPNGKLAIGGDGESTCDIEVGDSAAPSDVADATSGALQDAIHTAVDDATARLQALEQKTHRRRR